MILACSHFILCYLQVSVLCFSSRLLQGRKDLISNNSQVIFLDQYNMGSRPIKFGNFSVICKYPITENHAQPTYYILETP